MESTEIKEILLTPTGINPKLWGPHFWLTLFYTGMNYPVKIDKNNRCHITIRKHYKMFFCSLQYTLPCIFCLESYRRFWKEDEIDKFLNSRMDLLKWLYMLKDKVNKKLIQQEKQKFNSIKKIMVDKYRAKYGTQSTWKKTVIMDINSKLDREARRVLKTKPSPTLKNVMARFAGLRGQVN